MNNYGIMPQLWTGNPYGLSPNQILIYEAFISKYLIILTVNDVNGFQLMAAVLFLLMIIIVINISGSVLLLLYCGFCDLVMIA